MQRRIFHSMCVLVVFTIVVSTMLGAVFSGEFGKQVKDELKALRVTMIAPSGEVLFDNFEDSTGLENHMDRPEVADAIRSGAGESERFSETLGETTYYYATRAGDGKILRDSFVVFCKECGEAPGTYNEFSMRLKAIGESLGFTKKPSNGHQVWIGIRLR